MNLEFNIQGNCLNKSWRGLKMLHFGTSVVCWGSRGVNFLLIPQWLVFVVHLHPNWKRLLFGGFSKNLAKTIEISREQIRLLKDEDSYVFCSIGFLRNCVSITCCYHRICAFIASNSGFAWHDFYSSKPACYEKMMKSFSRNFNSNYVLGTVMYHIFLCLRSNTDFQRPQTCNFAITIIK